MRRAGAFFIADLLAEAGPQAGRRIVTRALPGQSWHQWGLAMDCYVMEGEQAVWNHEKYRPYAEVANTLGLTAGYDWGWDGAHVQLPAGKDKVLDKYRSWEALDKALRAEYE